MAWSGSLLIPRVEVHEAVFRPSPAVRRDQLGLWSVGWRLVHLDAPEAFPPAPSPEVLAGEGVVLVSEMVVHCRLLAADRDHLSRCEPPPSANPGCTCLKRSLWLGEGGWGVIVEVDSERILQGPSLTFGRQPPEGVFRKRMMGHSIESRGPITAVVRSGVLSAAEHDLLVLCGMRFNAYSYPEDFSSIELFGMTCDIGSLPRVSEQ